MRKLRTLSLRILLTAGFVACSDDHPAGPGGQPEVPVSSAPSGMVISNPRTSAGTAGSIGVYGSLSAANIVYISAEPGTLPDASSVTVRNRTRNGPERAIAVINGGFDPVAIEADAGDELSLTISTVPGKSILSAVKVPVRRPPVIVRTEPSKGRTDVALNVQITVVFSEPVEKSSVTPSTLGLLTDGNPVSGQPQVAPDGLSAAFIPDDPLQPATSYTLVVNSGIRDLDGESLVDASTVDFKTSDTKTPAQLVFTGLPDRQIYAIGADGTGLTRLTESGDNARPVFSPDGSRIAFARHNPQAASNYLGEIWTMNSDGSNVVRQTNFGSFWSAVWSPDGKKLAVSDEGVYYSSIWVIDLDSPGAPAKFIANDARTPAWSPDGKKIAFVRTSGDDGYHQIFIMNTDGSDQQPLTIFDSGGIYGLSWSPDGKRLAFSKCLGSCAIYTMASDGSDWQTVVATSNAGGAEWSPDGKWIAFTINDYSGTFWAPSVAYVSAKGGPVHMVAKGYWPSWRR